MQHRWLPNQLSFFSVFKPRPDSRSAAWQLNDEELGLLHPREFGEKVERETGSTRQSGRTTKIIIQALQVARKKSRVAICVSSCRECQRVAIIIREWARILGINTTYIHILTPLSFNGATQNVDYSAILYDHTWKELVNGTSTLPMSPYEEKKEKEKTT